MRPHLLTATLVLLVPFGLLSGAQNNSPLPVSEIVERMVQQDAHRQTLTLGYSGMRRYVLENGGMRKRAEMLVRVSGDSDGTKHFEVLAEEGWQAAQRHVLRKMLESESQSSHPEARAKSRLCADNYDFLMSGEEKIGDRFAYKIEVTPKRKDQYLFAGYIWVDAEDYALVRVDGSPAKNPSFWTKHVHFVQTYDKNGPFWFPRTTESITDARIFGRTDLTIEYFDYKPNLSQIDVGHLTAESFGRK